MSTANEPQPTDFYQGVECAKCGEPSQPHALEQVPDGFLATCEKCQHQQTYSIADLKRFQWVPSGD